MVSVVLSFVLVAFGSHRALAEIYLPEASTFAIYRRPSP
jgi:hypothetical protein